MSPAASDKKSGKGKRFAAPALAVVSVLVAAGAAVALLPMLHLDKLFSKERVEHEWKSQDGGVLALAYKTRTLGNGQKVYLPRLYWNGRQIEANERTYSNWRTFPFDPSVQSALTYKDYRDLSDTSHTYMVSTSDEVSGSWYVYVRPSSFSREEYDQISAMIEAHRGEIDGSLRRMTRYSQRPSLFKIGVVAYAEPGSNAVFNCFGNTYIVMSPGGQWSTLQGTHRNGELYSGSIGTPYGMGRIQDGVPVYDIPYVGKAWFKYSAKGAIPFDPHFIRNCRDENGRAFGDRYQVRLLSEDETAKSQLTAI